MRSCWVANLKQILIQQEMLKNQQLIQETNKYRVFSVLAGCRPGDGDQLVAHL